MAQQGISGVKLSRNNEEIVKLMEQLRKQRLEMNYLIERQEAEKSKIQNEVEKLTFKLTLLNKSLNQRIQARSDYDRTISEVEQHYIELVGSSDKLLDELKKETMELEEIMDKKIGTPYEGDFKLMPEFAHTDEEDHPDEDFYEEIGPDSQEPSNRNKFTGDEDERFAEEARKRALQQADEGDEYDKDQQQKDKDKRAAADAMLRARTREIQQQQQKPQKLEVVTHLKPQEEPEHDTSDETSSYATTITTRSSTSAPPSESMGKSPRISEGSANVNRVLSNSSSNLTVLKKSAENPLTAEQESDNKVMTIAANEKKSLASQGEEEEDVDSEEELMRVVHPKGKPTMMHPDQLKHKYETIKKATDDNVSLFGEAYSKQHGETASTKSGLSAMQSKNLDSMPKRRQMTEKRPSIAAKALREYGTKKNPPPEEGK